MNKRQKIIRKGIEAADGLSLGISMVVAVLIGVGIGYFLKNLTGIIWLFWVGVFIGVAAAILNVYKAYKAQVKSYEEFKEENRYKDLKNDPKA
ncbi:AtpZ/AtpI family protein [Campylobacter sp. LMG 7929]|uniref:AtpZ/AtpI family protein n=1 Tax=Campylobacter lari TaxID=201 RepID=A0A7M1MHI4_CAMLA|nr:AtpZ/AtpI family protein [Campylobacter sp. CNRCH_2015_0338h]EAH6868709.1 AtpZ/AtpI family protein [Campylobacter lari]MCR8683307.1 AtpZ/AtpI family protein [Campylobacter sp. LMG 17559]MCR8698217.1 AtpZ/AtpI family protein [Campylobacter sp. LMG 7929]EGK7485543.1 AtpZ/AtpI family protein [Campylobacter lari]MCV3471781.1 AtpZ/AtpI family protein [Campylobacter sp. CNRCH_2015_0338h]